MRAMTATETASDSLRYRWSRDEFVRAWEADAFEHRVELIEGEVWAVPIGPWHGDVTGQLIRALPDGGVKVTMATLPSGQSLPDPDCWVRRAGAVPTESIGRRLAAWRPEDVLLVVEVSDDSIMQDLGVKATIYAQAGYGAYWVVTPDAIYEHTVPTPEGYRERVTYRPGERIPVDYADTELDVGTLLAG